MRMCGRGGLELWSVTLTFSPIAAAVRSPRKDRQRALADTSQAAVAIAMAKSRVPDNRKVQLLSGAALVI